eukprot:1696174-Prymnesium_polylepis.2
MLRALAGRRRSAAAFQAVRSAAPRSAVLQSAARSAVRSARPRSICGCAPPVAEWVPRGPRPAHA